MDEEEIAGRGEGFFRFVALLAPRALLERPTLNPSLIRDQLRLMANVPSIGSPRCWELCLGQRAYANLVADARLLVKLDDGSRWPVFARRSRRHLELDVNRRGVRTPIGELSY
jgi:hypothetical protein